MKYDERIKILKEKVIKFLEDYEIPTSFDKARAQKEMKFMCEDLNRKIPSDYKKEQVDSLMDAISQYCRENMSHVKCPKSIDFREELPRHPTGKLYKRLLKDEYWGKGKAI